MRGMNGARLCALFVVFYDWGWFESSWRAVEFHADAAGGLGVSRVRWVCVPVVMLNTLGGSR